MKRLLMVLSLLLVLSLGFTALAETTDKRIAAWLQNIFPDTVASNWCSDADYGTVSVNIWPEKSFVNEDTFYLEIYIDDYTTSDSDNINRVRMRINLDGKALACDIQTFIDNQEKIASALGLKEEQLVISASRWRFEPYGVEIPKAWRNDVDCVAVLAEYDDEPTVVKLGELLKRLTNAPDYVDYESASTDENNLNEVIRTEKGVQLIEVPNNGSTGSSIIRIENYNADEFKDNDRFLVELDFPIKVEGLGNVLCSYYTQICEDLGLNDGQLEIEFWEDTDEGRVKNVISSAAEASLIPVKELVVSATPAPTATPVPVTASTKTTAALDLLNEKFPGGKVEQSAKETYSLMGLHMDENFEMQYGYGKTDELLLGNRGLQLLYDSTYGNGGAQIILTDYLDEENLFETVITYDSASFAPAGNVFKCYREICAAAGLQEEQLIMAYEEAENNGVTHIHSVFSAAEAEQYAVNLPSGKASTPAAQPTAAPIPADDSALGTVKVLGGTNVRATANSSGAIAGFIAADGSYPYYEIQSGWYKIKLEDGSFGYVYQSRIAK